jgi:hypothetical protein
VHAVVIRFTINDRLALATELEEVVREVSAAPGFVAVYGVALGQDEGISILVFDSEVSASLEGLAAQVAEHRAVTVATVGSRRSCSARLAPPPTKITISRAFHGRARFEPATSGDEPSPSAWRRRVLSRRTTCTSADGAVEADDITLQLIGRAWPGAHAAPMAGTPGWPDRGGRCGDGGRAVPRRPARSWSRQPRGPLAW